VPQEGARHLNASTSPTLNPCAQRTARSSGSLTSQRLRPCPPFAPLGATST
jgi:hypothetical protein